MKIRLMFIVFVMSIGYSYSQDYVDTINVMYNAKINTIKFKSIQIQRDKLLDLNRVINDTVFCKAKVLKHTGFRNTIFIKIIIADKLVHDLFRGYGDFEKNYIDFRNGVEEYSYSEFILAYSIIKKKYYKLKGFVENDFPLFHRDYIMIHGSTEGDILYKRKKWMKYYSVEELDLYCLMKSRKARKKRYSKYPCLEPSTSRRIIILGIPFFL
jgi:hypothetical protein